MCYMGSTFFGFRSITRHPCGKIPQQVLSGALKYRRPLCSGAQLLKGYQRADVFSSHKEKILTTVLVLLPVP